MKELGDPVYAGTLNLDGDLFIEVQRLPDAGALSRIVAMIRQAHANKGRYEQLADRVTAWFLPTVVAIALAAGVFHTAHHGFDRGLMAGLAVLVIACPCALGIATPLAIWVAMNEAARQQVVFRSGEALERLASLRHLGIDKTGTLTHGRASGVATWIPGDPHDAAHALERARALAAVSNHSLAQAIAAHGDKPAKRCDHVQTLPGRGLRGSWPDTGETIWVGSDRLMAEQHLAVTQCLAEAAGAARTSGQPLVFIGWGDSVRGLFIIREEIRSEAAAAIAELRDLGVRVTILTGDHARRAEVVAGALRVEARGEMLPENKVAFIAGVPGPVGIVGDGINDGPALAASDVGIAMGCGADVTRDSAGVCLLSDDLTRLPWAINLARRTVGVIRQNLFWALAYNVVGIGLAAAGLLNPVLAAAAMTVSSVLVVANSLRLRGPDKEAAPCLKPS